MSDRATSSANLRVTGSRSPAILIRRFARRIFTIRFRYEDALERQRAQALHIMCLTFAALGMGGSLALYFLLPQLFSVNPIVTLIANLVMGLAFMGVVEWLQNGNLRRASFGFVFLTLLIPTLEYAIFHLIGPEAVFLSLTVPIMSAALLLSPTWTFAMAALAIGIVGLVSYLDYRSALEMFTGDVLADQIGKIRVAALVSGFLLIILAFFSWLLTLSLFRWADIGQRRARQLEAAAVIAETSASALSLNALLNVVVERIRDAFGFYHAQVFLIEPDGRLAKLQASTGRAGVALMARGHALRVGSQSMVGQTAFLGEPIVVNDTALSGVWRPNELLPDTRAEVTLPLKVGNAVIGVLDVQSVQINMFQPEDVRTLQVMTQQLATTIEKTRLVDELQARAGENEQLFQEAQASLRQVEDLNRRLTREGWSEYIAARRLGGTMGYTLEGEDIDRDASWTAPMRQAYIGEQSVVVRQGTNAQIAAVPLRVRGEVIGVLEVERGGNRPWTDDELDMAETLVDRLALAVENARLYEQATQATEREQVINKIAQDVQAAETIDQILQAALTELGSVLGASRGIVQISPKSEQPQRSGTTGPLPYLGA